MRGRPRLDLDPAGPAPTKLARQHEHTVAELEEPLGPDAELLPGIGDAPGIGSHAVVPAVGARQVWKGLGPMPFDILGLKAEDRLEVRAVDRVVQDLKGCHVLAHAR